MKASVYLKKHFDSKPKLFRKLKVKSAEDFLKQSAKVREYLHKNYIGAFFSIIAFTSSKVKLDTSTVFANSIFVLPLIIIDVIAIKGKGVMSTSNWIREHLHIIKLLSALFFLGIAIYFFQGVSKTI